MAKKRQLVLAGLTALPAEKGSGTTMPTGVEYKPSFLDKALHRVNLMLGVYNTQAHGSDIQPTNWTAEVKFALSSEGQKAQRELRQESVRTIGIGLRSLEPKQ